MRLKTYLEIKVPIFFDASWFEELRTLLKDVPVHWQKNYYHITMAFVDDTQNLPEVEAIMHKYLDNAIAVTITFDKLDVFTTNTGMQIINLTTSSIPVDFQTLVDDIRREICYTNSCIQSEFRLHLTLGRITAPQIGIDYVRSLIEKTKLIPFTQALNEVEYREFRGRSIFKKILLDPPAPFPKRPD